MRESFWAERTSLRRKSTSLRKL